MKTVDSAAIFEAFDGLVSGGILVPSESNLFFAEVVFAERNGSRDPLATATYRARMGVALASANDVLIAQRRFIERGAADPRKMVAAC